MNYLALPTLGDRRHGTSQRSPLFWLVSSRDPRVKSSKHRLVNCTHELNVLKSMDDAESKLKIPHREEDPMGDSRLYFPKLCVDGPIK